VAETPEAVALSWQDVLSWLDANFVFRVSEAERARSYRLSPNGSAIRVQETTAGVVAELDQAVPGLDELSRGSSAGRHKYSVRSLEHLEKVVRAIRGSVTRPATKGVSSVAETPSSNLSQGTTMLSPTNTILYGPPGTGKTHETARRAVLLCDGTVSETRAELMARYNELRAEQRITFITFHQSYGYEEFVEGLRPRMDTSSRQVVYDVVPGAFRRACDSARIRQLVKPGLAGKPLRERTICKMSLGVTGTAEGTKVFQYCIEHSCVLLGWGLDVDFTECSDEDAIRKKLQAEKPTAERLDSHVWFVNFFKNELEIGDIIVVSKGNAAFRAIGEVTGDYEFAEDAPFQQKRQVKWLAVFEAGMPVDEIFGKQFSMQALYKLNPEKLHYEIIEKLVSTRGEAGSKPHVFIIDEINRANISKVFGELITLLEPDKREGELNALSVKLPYSAEDLSVPANLHLIGTMNTADRSIALLDTALRRRFDFEELMPEPAVLKGRIIEGIDLVQLLQSLNERIELVYDRDHTIGHAFFLGANTLADLEVVFRRKVLPLLQEYFYENWSKVRRVLNDLGEGDFIRREKLAPLPADGEDDYVDEPRTVYCVNKNPFPPVAYTRIYGAP
jgi:5-methylcytosine-specific restriction enzyme B